MISVLATIRLQPGSRAEFLEHFLAVVPLVQAETGCIEYGPWIDVETTIPAQGEPDVDRVIVLEKWETLDDLESHLIAPHMLAYRQQVKSLVQDVTLQILGAVQQLGDLETDSSDD